jgi:hypothetical protein
MELKNIYMLKMFFYGWFAELKQAAEQCVGRTQPFITRSFSLTLWTLWEDWQLLISESRGVGHLPQPFLMIYNSSIECRALRDG